jgi:hypothetical protein
MQNLKEDFDDEDQTASNHPIRAVIVGADQCAALGRVRSIGEAARLRVATHGVGFEPAQECTAASPMRLAALKKGSAGLAPRQAGDSNVRKV